MCLPSQSVCPPSLSTTSTLCSDLSVLLQQHLLPGLDKADICALAWSCALDLNWEGTLPYCSMYTLSNKCMPIFSLKVKIRAIGVRLNCFSFPSTDKVWQIWFEHGCSFHRAEDLKVSHGKLWRSGPHHSQPLSSVSIISNPPPVKTSAHPLRLWKKKECSTKQCANDTETIKSIVWFLVGRKGYAGEVTPFSENGVRELLLSWWLPLQVWQGDLLSPEKPISQPVPADLEEGHNLDFSMIYDSLQGGQKQWDCAMWNLMRLTISKCRNYTGDPANILNAFSSWCSNTQIGCGTQKEHNHPARVDAAERLTLWC